MSIENNVTAQQWFTYLFIIMSNTVFLSIVHKATKHSTYKQSNFSTRSFLLQCPRTFPCHFIFGTPSRSWGRRLGRDPTNPPAQEMPTSPSPHTPALSSTSQAASRTCARNPFSLSLFLQTSDLGTAALSALSHPGPICAVLRKGTVQLRRTPLGTTWP